MRVDLMCMEFLTVDIVTKIDVVTILPAQCTHGMPHHNMGLVLTDGSRALPSAFLPSIRSKISLTTGGWVWSQRSIYLRILVSGMLD